MREGGEDEGRERHAFPEGYDDVESGEDLDECGLVGVVFAESDHLHPVGHG